MKQNRAVQPEILRIVIMIVLIIAAIPLFTAADVPIGNIGTMMVLSHPGAASVYIDGTYKGTTTTGSTLAEQYTVVAGIDHTLLVQKSGYQDYTTTFSVQPGEQKSTEVTLTPTPPPPSTGQLTVTSSPSGASVTLDGVYEGRTTPTTFNTVYPGTHSVRVSLPDYSPWSGTVQITAGQMTNIPVNLHPVDNTGALKIDSYPSGADVYIDDNYYDSTPSYTGNLRQGSHVVVLHKNGYSTWSDSVYINSGQTKYLSVNLNSVVKPTSGTIGVTSDPAGAGVYVDSVFKGRTLSSNELDIPGILAGSHQVQLTMPGYNDYTTTIAVTNGATTNVNAVLTKTPTQPTTGTLVIKSTPSGADLFYDGTYKGITPITISDAAAGSHTLVLDMDGFQESQTTITAVAGQVLPVSVTLNAAVPIIPIQPAGTSVSLSPLVIGAIIIGVLILIGLGIFVGIKAGKKK